MNYCFTKFKVSYRAVCGRRHSASPAVLKRLAQVEPAVTKTRLEARGSEAQPLSGVGPPLIKRVNLFFNLWLIAGSAAANPDFIK
jgi:hypothetical protein